MAEISWKSREEMDAPYEANFLKLDCSRIKRKFGWRTQWHIDEAVEQTVRFTDVWMRGGDIKAEMDREIEEYCRGFPM